MSRPVIGLTTYAEEARFGLNDTFAAVLPLAYVHAVHSTGGRAVLITPDDPDTDVLDGLDGIIFTGGSDVDPSLYGATPHPTTVVKPERDAAEAMLMRAALDADLPLLAICRGMQALNVARGGTLHQHLPGHRQTAPATTSTHAVSIRAGSRLARVLGREELQVNSFHHQAVDTLGRGLRAVAHSADGTVEAVEAPGARFVLAVQWHAEALAGEPRHRALFEALVSAATDQPLRRAA
jgi:putative glutamine amidotransferase